jgi:hypothetical protein
MKLGIGMLPNSLGSKVEIAFQDGILIEAV